MKILIAYDGSTCADEALDDLKRAGLPDDTEAIVLSVADVWVMPTDSTKVPPVSTTVSAALQEARQVAEQAISDAEALAESAAERIRANFPTWSVRAAACANSPAWGILLQAEEAHADLIVVGSHGRSSLGRWMLGSVSHTVVTHARCPVRVARGHGPEAERPVRIMVGVDGSTESRAAVRAVASRHWSAGTDVRVVAAVNPTLAAAVIRPDIEKWIESDDATGYDWVYRFMEIVAAELQANDLSVSTLVKHGDAKQILLEEAERFGADCIFVGARGLNTVDRILLGSVSTAVATRADCSVEVIRNPMSKAGNA